MYNAAPPEFSLARIVVLNSSVFNQRVNKRRKGFVPSMPVWNCLVCCCETQREVLRKAADDLT